MTCNQCGSRIPEDSIFCPFCGQILMSSDQIAELPSDSTDLYSDPNLPSQSPASDSPAKSHKKRNWIIGISILAVILVAFGIFVVPSIQDGKEALAAMNNGKYNQAATMYTELSPLGQCLYRDKIVTSFAAQIKTGTDVSDIAAAPLDFVKQYQKYQSISRKLEAEKVKSTNLQEYLDKSVSTLKSHLRIFAKYECFYYTLNSFPDGYIALCNSAKFYSNTYRVSYFRKANQYFSEASKIISKYTKYNDSDILRFKEFVDYLESYTATENTYNVFNVVSNTQDEIDWYEETGEAAIVALTTVDLSPLYLSNLHY